MAPDGTVDETAARPLGVGGRAAARHDRSGDDDREGPAALTGSEIVQFEFTGIDDQTIDLDLEFECLVDGVLLGSCDSVLATPTAPGDPLRGRGRAHAVRQAHVRGARHRRAWEHRPDPGQVDVDVRRRARARHRDRPRPRVGDRGHDRDVHLHRRGGERDARLRLRVLARRRRLHLLHLAARDRRADGRPARLRGARDGSGRPGRHDARPLRVAGDAAGRPDAAGDDGRGPPRPRLGSRRRLRLPGERDRRGVRVHGRQRRVDGCDGVLELEGLALRPAHGQARAIDLVGNVDPTPASHNWTGAGRARDDDHVRVPTDLRQARPRPSPSSRTRSARPSGARSTARRSRLHLAVPGGRAADEDNAFEVYAANQFRYLDGTQVQDLSPAEYEWIVQDVEPPDTRDRLGARTSSPPT